MQRWFRMNQRSNRIQIEGELETNKKYSAYLWSFDITPNAIKTERILLQSQCGTGHSSQQNNNNNKIEGKQKSWCNGERLREFSRAEWLNMPMNSPMFAQNHGKSIDQRVFSTISIVSWFVFHISHNS